MIFYVAKEFTHYRPFFETWGRGVAHRIRHLGYDELIRSVRLPSGTYIFADIERLTPHEACEAANVWTHLSEEGRERVRLLNHPTRSMRRYELLRQLYRRGKNHFNVYRVTEGERPDRYPVFIRQEHEHTGSLTKLIDGPKELERQLNELSLGPHYRDNLLVVEFCDCADTTGVYRKYGAYIIGDHIISDHSRSGTDWMLKWHNCALAAGDGENLNVAVSEERSYVEDNPHEQQLREVFELAKIQYGRIDYSLHEGQIQVWEINSHPAFTNPLAGGAAYRYVPTRMSARQHVVDRVVEALNDIDLSKTGPRIRAFDPGSRMRHLVYRMVGFLPLRRQSSVRRILQVGSSCLDFVKARLALWQYRIGARPDDILSRPSE